MKAYRDPTADAAVANVMREWERGQKEARKKTDKGSRNNRKNRNIRGGLKGSPFAVGRNGKDVNAIFDMTDNTPAIDQQCGNCHWWNPDPVTDEMRCQNRESENCTKMMEEEDWCWCWQKEKRTHGR